MPALQGEVGRTQAQMGMWGGVVQQRKFEELGGLEGRACSRSKIDSLELLVCSIFDCLRGWQTIDGR